jgi:sarcosine oxidase
LFGVAAGAIAVAVHFDAIVVGLGGVGSSALLCCAQRKLRVLGIDRFVAGHDRGSSHGETRVIRMAYFEHPDYVPLLRRAYRLWADLDAWSGERLYAETGVLQIGPETGAVVPGVLRAAAEHGLAVEVGRRFPGFEVPSGMQSVFEARGGYLHVEACVRASVRRAQSLGASVCTEAVLGWERAGATVRVRTDRGEVSCDRLLVAPGPWAGHLLPVRTSVLRKVMLWFAADARYDAAPVFLYDLGSDGVYYGFPRIAGSLKAAEHTGGETVNDPTSVDRELHAGDVTRVTAALRLLPGVAAEEPLRHAVCMYTSSCDGHFIVGGGQGLAYVCGLSGHGFKMASVLGEILADLACDGGTPHRIDLFLPRAERS